MQPNPLRVACPDPAVSWPLAELKQHLILHVATPPGPKTARAVYDLYRQTFGDPFRAYTSTAFGKMLRDWTPAARQHFEQVELPDLRQHEDWGYAFSDQQPTDSWLFMFHGFQPSTEAGKASFYRFEFDWQLPPERLLVFAEAVLQLVHCVSGNAGYVFQGLPQGPYAKSSFDQIYAWARRYWGVEAQDLDVTVDHMLNAYKCPSWLTIIGEPLAGQQPAALAAAEAAALHTIRAPGGVILQAGAAPELGDRNRNEKLPIYEAIARALEPLQVKAHASFGGSRWTDESTQAWLRRFSDPARLAAIA